MTTFPARRALSPVSDRQPPQENHWETLEAASASPFEWARRRRAEREARRVEAAGHRALHRLEHLGPAWHVVESPRLDLGYGAAAPRDRAGFLAVGPGGVFAITVADHGRARVLIAGDVVQINGRRPPYVAEARREAKRASKALSAAIGRTIPVFPVLTFVGTGAISAHGLPRDCLVANYRELDRLLVAGGARISPSTAEKLAEVARDPATWMNGPYRSNGYDWYAAGGTATGKPARS
ncbi:MAG TPA: hypothetical protein VNV66_17455, partial [Pilimelia sp.]|nr:hypothetical protein [Pilimelia sp.]